MVSSSSHALLSPATFEDEKGRAETRNPIPGLLRLDVTNHYTLKLATEVRRCMDAVGHQGAPVLLFADFSQMSSYDSGSRRAMTQWCIDHRDQVACVHVLSSNRIVRMGVATAAMALSLVGLSLHSHESANSFRIAFGEALDPTPPETVEER